MNHTGLPTCSLVAILARKADYDPGIACRQSLRIFGAGCIFPNAWLMG
jgi:hypothetical protein